MEINAKLATAVALFVAVASALVVIPTMDSAYAETTVPSEIGGDALLGQAVDGTIVLENDIVLTSALIVTGELIIDLNGHSIVNSDANANHTIEVSETGDLTIKDSVGTGTIDNVTHGKAALLNNGTVDIMGGKLTRSLESASNTYYVIDNHGTLTVQDGVTVSKTSEEQHSSMIRNADGATLTIQGGTFESGKDIAVKNDTGGVLRIYDGTFTPAKISTDFAVQNWGTATIMGGTFKGIVASMSDDENASTMTVENGTFSGKVLAWNFVDNYVSGMDPADKAASVVINGGNFSTPASNYAAIIGGTGSTILVTDPTIASYVINGGTFGSNVSQYLADDVVLVNRDGKYVVTQDTAGSVAQVGQVYFTDLATAFKNCADSTVVLTDDITLGASVTITKNNVVVDLNGHVISGELSGRFVYTHDKTVTFKDSVGGGAIINLGGDAISGKDGDTCITVESGLYTGDVSDYVPETMTVYDFQGISIVSEVVSEPVIIIDDVPFAAMDNVADFVNAAGGSMDATDDTLVLLDDFQVGGAKVTVPVGSDITIDLNGNDIVFDVVDVAGKLTLADDSQIPGTVTSAGITVNGGTLTGDVVVTSATAGSIVQIVGSGTVDGITVDMSDVSGGAVEVYSGTTGAVTVSDLTIMVDDENAAVDRGIYINETAQGGSVVVSDIVFDFNGNDASPVVVDIDSDSHVTVSDLTYIDCARPNKVLVNATSDVTIGSEGNIDISDASDVVLWDASGTDNVFTVAGEYIVNGRTVITSGGDVVVPEGAVMIVNAVVEVASGSTPEGTVHFGSDAKDALTMNDVVIGDDGFKLSLGSVTMSGSVESGSISVSGNGVVDGDLDLGASKLSIPEGSQLTVMRDVQLSGTEPVDVKGKVTVYGTVSAPVANGGEVYTIAGSGEVTGDVTGTEPVEKKDEPLSIEFVPDMTWTVGETYRLSLGVHPIDAKITGIHGAEDWLTFEDHVLIGQPLEVGTYEIELTIGIYVDGELQSKQTDFTITVVEEPVEEPDVEDDPIDWRLVVIAVILVIMVIALLVRFI